MSLQLHGIVPPLVTPLEGPDRLDVAGLEALVEHVIRGGVHGLFILGTTGEAPNLTHRLRRELVDRVCRQASGRLPVLVGITDTSFVEAVNLASHAADAGASAVVTSAPYYFTPGQPELIDFVTQIVRQVPLPLFLYNMPQMTKVQFEPETLRQVAQFERIAGVKDSSGSMDYFLDLMKVAKGRPDWRLFVGPEHLLVGALRAGGHGGVNGGAQIDPGLLVQLYEATVADDDARVGVLQDRLLRLGRIYSIGKHASTVIKGIKCALSLMGFCRDDMALPFAAFNPRERDQVRQVLEELGLLGAGSIISAANSSRR